MVWYVTARFGIASEMVRCGEASERVWCGETSEMIGCGKIVGVGRSEEASKMVHCGVI